MSSNYKKNGYGQDLNLLLDLHSLRVDILQEAGAELKILIWVPLTLVSSDPPLVSAMCWKWDLPCRITGATDLNYLTSLFKGICRIFLKLIKRNKETRAKLEDVNMKCKRLVLETRARASTDCGPKICLDTTAQETWNWSCQKRKLDVAGRCLEIM